MKIAKIHNAGNMGCPTVMLELNKTINSMSIGEILEFVSSEQFSARDIPLWSGRTGHDLLNITETDGEYHFFIQKNERIQKFKRSHTL